MCDVLLIREDTTAAESATTGAAATTESASKTEAATKTAAATGTDTTATATGTNTKSATKTGTATGKSSGSSSNSTTSVSINPAAGAGGISMLIPTEGATSYYKIGDFVTLEWNYTSLTISPTAVNVVASCSLNSATYTISSNMTMSPTGKVVWDTKKYQANATVPLLTASYTLIVWDASKAITETASAGYLSAASSYIFGMYSSQPYTPLNGMLSPLYIVMNLLTSDRICLRYLQRRFLRARTVRDEVHLWHVRHHRPVLHLVRRGLRSLLHMSLISG